MVAIFDSPDFLLNKNQISEISFLKKFLYFILGIIVSLVYKFTDKKIFSFLINILLKRNTKIYYERPYYIAVEDNNKFFYPNKRVVRQLNGIKEQNRNLFQSYMLDKVKINSGDTIIDCGANVGEIFIYLNSKFDSINYVAFEPDSKVFECLKLNTKNDKNVKIYNTALSCDSVKKKFYLDTEGGDSSLEFFGNENYVELTTSTIDSYKFKKIKLLKIDAEGHEHEVLQGSTNTLKHIEYISVDCGPERGINNLNTLPETLNFLIKNRFQLLAINYKRGTVLFRNQLLI